MILMITLIVLLLWRCSIIFSFSQQRYSSNTFICVKPLFRNLCDSYKVEVMMVVLSLCVVRLYLCVCVCVVLFSFYVRERQKSLLWNNSHIFLFLCFLVVIIIHHTNTHALQNWHTSPSNRFRSFHDYHFFRRIRFWERERERERERVKIFKKIQHQNQ